MNFLPKELENIIIDYKYQLEYSDEFKQSLDIIKNIKIEVEEFSLMLPTKKLFKTFYYISNKQIIKQKHDNYYRTDVYSFDKYGVLHKIIYTEHGISISIME